MDVALTMRLTDNQFEKINCVRQWHNVKYLSEVQTKGGDLLMSGNTHGTNGKNQCRRLTGEPRQSNCNSYSWKFWKKLLLSFMTDRKNLKNSLGKWTKNHSKNGRWAS